MSVIERGREKVRKRYTKGRDEETKSAACRSKPKAENTIKKIGMGSWQIKEKK